MMSHSEASQRVCAGNSATLPPPAPPKASVPVIRPSIHYLDADDSLVGFPVDRGKQAILPVPIFTVLVRSPLNSSTSG
jgi:hypothetical protein